MQQQFLKGNTQDFSIEQIFKERGGYEIIGIIKGSEMIDWIYQGPYDHFEAQKIYGGYPFSNSDLKKMLDFSNNMFP